MRDGRNVELVINLIILLFVGSLVVSLIPVFFSLFLFVVFVYGIFIIFRYVTTKVFEKKAPHYDEQGRRIAKVSIIDIKDSDDSEES